MNTGIYKIKNLVNGKIYIGSSYNLAKRNYHHFYALRKNNHRNRHLQHAFVLYGEAAFLFEIIELLPSCENKVLLEREQYWIDKLSATDTEIGYNINPLAGNCGGRPCSFETKEKLRLINLGKKHSKETKEKIRLAGLGRTHVVSQEARDKISKSHMGKKLSEEQKIKMRRVGEKNHFFGKKHSKETKNKISKAKSGKKLSKEHKNKIGESNTGKKRSKEHKDKIILSNSTRFISEETRQKMSNARKGKKLSEETRQKMSEAHRKKNAT